MFAPLSLSLGILYMLQLTRENYNVHYQGDATALNLYSIYTQIVRISAAVVAVASLTELGRWTRKERRRMKCCVCNWFYCHFCCFLQWLRVAVIGGSGDIDCCTILVVDRVAYTCCCCCIVVHLTRIDVQISILFLFEHGQKTHVHFYNIVYGRKSWLIVNKKEVNLDIFWVNIDQREVSWWVCEFVSWWVIIPPRSHIMLTNISQCELHTHIVAHAHYNEIQWWPIHIKSSSKNYNNCSISVVSLFLLLFCSNK